MLKRVMVGINVNDGLPILHHLLCPPPRAAGPPGGPPPDAGRLHGPYGQWIQAAEGHFVNPYPRFVTTTTREVATSKTLPPISGPLWGHLPLSEEDGGEGRLAEDEDLEPHSKHAGAEQDFEQFVGHLRGYVLERTQQAKKDSTKGKIITVFSRVETSTDPPRWAVDAVPLHKYLRSRKWSPSVKWKGFWTYVANVKKQCFKLRNPPCVALCQDLYVDIQAVKDD
jgi:hypothetical protein